MTALIILLLLLCKCPSVEPFDFTRLCCFHQCQATAKATTQSFRTALSRLIQHQSSFQKRHQFYPFTLGHEPLRKWCQVDMGQEEGDLSCKKFGCGETAAFSDFLTSFFQERKIHWLTLFILENELKGYLMESFLALCKSYS